MGNCSSNDNIREYNDENAKKPNDKKKFENIVYEYLIDRYKIETQKELYDFHLIDYNIYIEVDEEHHFKSGEYESAMDQSRRDNEKNIKCLEKPSTLLRISWFAINNGKYKKMIDKCLTKKWQDKIICSSKEVYENLNMLNGIDKDSIIYFS